MTELVNPIAEWAAAITEVVGVCLIVILALYALLFAAVRLLQRADSKTIFLQTRQRLGGGILLGLEFLVAADIIHTVAVELTLETVSTLAVIILIRTLLSFTLEVELTGDWPWQNDSSSLEDI